MTYWNENLIAFYMLIWAEYVPTYHRELSASKTKKIFIAQTNANRSNLDYLCIETCLLDISKAIIRPEMDIVGAKN